MTIHYLTGDATAPVKKPALIMHVCNDVGGWGRGFVLALSKKWEEPEARFRHMSRFGSDTDLLGQVQFVPVEDGISVVNMIAQHDIATVRGRPPIRYEALAECLGKIASHPALWWRDGQQEAERYTIHAPRLGCGLAGGSWSVVEPLIEFYLKDREVYIYDLPGESR